MGNTENQQISTKKNKINIEQNQQYPVSDSLCQSIIKKISENRQKLNIQVSKNNFRTIRFQTYQIYAQINEKNNQIFGFASIKNNNRLIFQGQFIQSLRNGYGVQYQNQIQIYQGSYANDLRHGWGKTSNYQGQFYRNLRHGYGKCSLKSNVYYEGLWKNDKFDGMGLYYQIANEKLNQNNSLNAMNLKRVMSKNEQFSNQQKYNQIYFGEWKQGKKSGLGKYRGKNEVYQGEFLNDLYHGQGTLTKNNQTKKGTFQKGLFIK